MTLQQAADLLNVTAGTSPVDVQTKYQDSYNQLQLLLTNAPTPNLKKLYQRNLQELEEAYALLSTRTGPDVPTDLPSATPVYEPVKPLPIRIEPPVENPATHPPVYPVEPPKKTPSLPTTKTVRVNREQPARPASGQRWAARIAGALLGMFVIYMLLLFIPLLYEIATWKKQAMALLIAGFLLRQTEQLSQELKQLVIRPVVIIVGVLVTLALVIALRLEISNQGFTWEVVLYASWLIAAIYFMISSKRYYGTDNPESPHLKKVKTVL